MNLSGHKVVKYGDGFFSSIRLLCNGRAKCASCRESPWSKVAYRMRSSVISNNRDCRYACMDDNTRESRGLGNFVVSCKFLMAITVDESSSANRLYKSYSKKIVVAHKRLKFHPIPNTRVNPAEFSHQFGCSSHFVQWSTKSLRGSLLQDETAQVEAFHCYRRTSRSIYASQCQIQNIPEW
jgi:hypothetical protein